MPGPDLNAIRDAVRELDDETNPDRFTVYRTETSFIGLTVEDALKLGLAD